MPAVDEMMNDYERDGLTHAEILERLPAFVVGALDPDEMLETEDYLHAHPELMARVHELELAAAKLAYAAPAQPLSKDLHAKVLNRARSSLPPRPQPAAAPRAAEHSPARNALQPARANVLSVWWRRRGFWDLGLAAAVAAVLILSILYRGALGDLDDLRRQVEGLEQQVASIQEQNNELQNTNTHLQEQLDTRQNQLAAIGDAQQMVALGGTDAAPSASGRLYVHDNEGTLVLNNLNPLSDEQVYQLWLIPPEGAPIPAGLLGHAGEAVETITLPLPASLDGIAAVGISVEPPGGSDVPTGPIVLLGEKA
jgi:anti-sigma-K factor RskA